MSFGFSVGDFLAVFELAAKIRKQWIDAPTEYTSMKNEIRSIESILLDIDDLRQVIDLSQQQNDDLQHASDSCREVLERCSAIVDKYSSTAGSRNGTAARMRRTWKRFQSDPDDIRHMRSQLSSLVGQLTALRDAIQIDVLRDVDENVEHINKTVGHVYDDTQALRASDAARQTSDEVREKDAIANWFSGSRFADQQNEFIKQRQPGTGRWFFHDDRYQEWSRKKGSPPILLCPGAPGSGKTMMFAGIVHDLCEHYRQQKDTVVIYFYCNFNRKDEQDLDQLYACLVRQLFQERSSVPQEAKSLYLKHRDRLSRPSTDELLLLLQTLIQKYKQVFILVDALDECNIDRSCRNLLIDELLSMASNQPEKDAKVLCTTRPIPEITGRFPVSPQIHIRAEEEDLAYYLNARMIEISCISSKVDLQEIVRCEITRLADGMFLLARLYFESLIVCTKAKSVRKALKDLPRGKEALFEMYDTARARIDHQLGQHRDLAHKVLVWITYARTELTIEQLQEAVAIEPGMTDLDHDDDIDDESVIISVCAGLVTVDQDTRVVRLVHKTTQEYLLRVREDWFPDAQNDIVQACLSYLSMDAFQADEWKIELQSYIQKYKLLLYAGKQWGYHLAATDNSEIYDQAHRFLCDDARSMFASQVMLGMPHVSFPFSEKNKSPSYRSFKKKVSRLHICAYFNAWKFGSVLIAMDADNCDLKDSQRKTPLMWAAEVGHTETVELLLRQPGVDADSSDIWGQTPLSRAVNRGHKEIIELLLRQPEVNVNVRDPSGQTPLLWVATAGYIEILELLLRRPELDVHLRDKLNNIPLSLAAKEGHEETVKRLLQQPEVNINARDDQHNTPLLAAVNREKKEMIEFLLQQPKVDINASNTFSDTPLLAAVKRGNKEIVELLLQQPKVDINARDTFSDRPLLAAVKRGNKEMVELLLKQPKVDINARDNRHNTPLSAAVRRGNKEIVELLLQHPKVDINSENGWDRTPLSLAVEEENREIIELLLRHPGIEVAPELQPRIDELLRQ